MALSLLKSRFLQDIICRPWIPVLICMDRFCQFQSWMSSVSYHYSFWLLSCNILAPACFPLREMALFLSACIHKYNLPFLVSGLQLFFNWRAITLQYCVDFCHTPSWISYRYTYVPSLLMLPAVFHTTVRGRRALGWTSYGTRQIPTGWLFYVWESICFRATLSIRPTLSIPH